jgi:hypothetical protein
MAAKRRKRGPTMNLRWSSAAQHKRVKDLAASYGMSLNAFICRQCDPLVSRPLRRPVDLAVPPEASTGEATA